MLSNGFGFSGKNCLILVSKLRSSSSVSLNLSSISYSPIIIFLCNNHHHQWNHHHSLPLTKSHHCGVKAFFISSLLTHPPSILRRHHPHSSLHLSLETPRKRSSSSLSKSSSVSIFFHYIFNLWTLLLDSKLDENFESTLIIKKISG